MVRCLAKLFLEADLLRSYLLLINLEGVHPLRRHVDLVLHLHELFVLHPKLLFSSIEDICAVC